MPSYPRITRIPNEFVAPQSFEGAITIVVGGVSVMMRPYPMTPVNGQTRAGWEASRDDGQTWKDAGSITHGS